MAIGDVFDWLTGTTSTTQGGSSESSLNRSEAQQAKSETARETTSTQNTTGTTNSQANQQQTGTTQQASAGTQQQQVASSTGTQQQTAGTVAQQISTLDANTVAALTGLVQNKIGAGGQVFSPETIAATQANEIIAKLIGDRASGGMTEIINAINAAKAGAQQEFSRDTVGGVLANAQKIGSTRNTTTQLLMQRGKEDLATKLAQIETSGVLQGRQLITEELTRAAAAGSDVAAQLRALDLGGSQGVNDIAKLIEQLRGANVNIAGATGQTTSGASTTAQTGTTTTAATTETINNLVNQLVQTAQSQQTQTSAMEDLVSQLSQGAAQSSAIGKGVQNLASERTGSLFDILRINLGR